MWWFFYSFTAERWIRDPNLGLSAWIAPDRAWRSAALDKNWFRVTDPLALDTHRPTFRRKNFLPEFPHNRFSDSSRDKNASSERSTNGTEGSHTHSLDRSHRFKNRVNTPALPPPEGQQVKKTRRQADDRTMPSRANRKSGAESGSCSVSFGLEEQTTWNPATQIRNSWVSQRFMFKSK